VQTNALLTIANYADNSANPVPTLPDYQAAGVTGVNATNLAAVNKEIEAALKINADEYSEIQALANLGAALFNIANYALSNGNTVPKLEDYKNAGITGVTADNLAAVNAQVDAASKADADQVSEVQILADAGAAAQIAALAKVEAYNNGNGSSPAALTAADYVIAGITGVTSDNLAAVNAQVLQQGVGGADTVAEVQALVAAANAALVKIEAYNNGNGVTPIALTVADYEAAGITAVSADNLAAVNAQVLK
jgi:hypothetical protein